MRIFKTVDQVKEEAKTKGYELSEFVPGTDVSITMDGDLIGAYAWRPLMAASESALYLPDSLVKESVISPDDSGIWVTVRVGDIYDD